MNPGATSLDALKDIKKMMEKSSRFISLSGWSGIAAGLCGVGGAFCARLLLNTFYQAEVWDESMEAGLLRGLIGIAGTTFLAAFVSAFIFTYIRSRKEGTPIWGASAKRLLWNTVLPMLVGGIVILHLLTQQLYQLIPAYTLIFYGLALVNGSKYTLGEIRYLGYSEIILGLINLLFPGLWFVLWTIGFGIMHIIYGVIMWWRYER